MTLINFLLNVRNEGIKEMFQSLINSLQSIIQI